MEPLDWGAIQNLAGRKATLTTKTGVPFQIVAASETAVTVRVSSGEEHPLSRAHLEAAVAKIQSGMLLTGPKEYRDLIADDRPTYAWAILRHLGYVK